MNGAPGYYVRNQWRLPAGGRGLPEPRADHRCADRRDARLDLRQWIAGPWLGPLVEPLRAKVDGLDEPGAIDDWLDDALAEGLDPL